MLSGGLDSTVTLATARHEGFETHALTFDYGQRHSLEIDAARRVAAHGYGELRVVIQGGRLVQIDEIVRHRFDT